MKDRAGRRWLRGLSEAALIVCSILLALALDAWWERVEEERRRGELVEELLTDFETTRSLIATSIETGDSLIARMDAFFQHVSAQEPVPTDSLRFLLSGAFRYFDFQPALSSYLGAVASGDLGLVSSRELIEALAEFDLMLEGAQERSRVWLEWYYLGDVAALRRQLGSVQVVADRSTANTNAIPSEFRLPEPAYRELVGSRSVHGLVEASYNFRSAIVVRLRGADAAAARVVEELETLSVR